MIIIEFLGMPGSGKTFFYKKLKKVLKKNKINTNSFKDFNSNKIIKFFYLIFFIVENFIYFLKIILLIKFDTDKSKESIKRHFYFFLRELIAYQALKKNNKVILNSEGFFYRLVFYFNNLKNKKNLNKLIKIINFQPRVKILIFINSYKKINILRANKRNNGFFYTNDSLNEYDIKNKNLKILANYLKKSKSVSLFVINNNINELNFKKFLKKIIKIIKKNEKN